MKIRNGFVSNSSSVSFCIYGARLPSDLSKDIRNLRDYNLDDFYGEFDDVYLGQDYTSMNEDETRREFEERIEKSLKDLFKDDYDKLFIGNWSESYRDG